MSGRGIFEKAFGVPGRDIKKNCILLPSNDRCLFAPCGFSSGMFFSVSESSSATLISLKSRWLAGDAALLLGDTPCENIMLFGGCGGLGPLPGDKLLVSKALNLESFTGFIRGACGEFIQPPGELSRIFSGYSSGRDIIQGACATVSSLALEYERKSQLTDKGVICLDMEASMVFSAASFCGKSAMALFYVTDSPGKVNFYDEYGKPEAAKIKGARKSLSALLSGFIESELV